jgi:hypothetical protein
MVIKMKSLTSGLIKIKNDPERYIGGKSLINLNLFISGYLLGQGQEVGRASDAMADFQEFLCDKFKVIPAVRWAKIVHFDSGSDESGFTKFYELWEEFGMTKSRDRSGDNVGINYGDNLQ